METAYASTHRDSQAAGKEGGGGGGTLSHCSRNDAYLSQEHITVQVAVDLGVALDARQGSAPCCGSASARYVPVRMSRCSWLVFTQISSSTRLYPHSSRHSLPSSMARPAIIKHSQNTVHYCPGRVTRPMGGACHDGLDVVSDQGPKHFRKHVTHSVPPIAVGYLLGIPSDMQHPTMKRMSLALREPAASYATRKIVRNACP